MYPLSFVKAVSNYSKMDELAHLQKWCYVQRKINSKILRIVSNNQINPILAAGRDASGFQRPYFATILEAEKFSKNRSQKFIFCYKDDQIQYKSKNKADNSSYDPIPDT
jgi:hypothetical protein